MTADDDMYLLIKHDPSCLVLNFLIRRYMAIRVPDGHGARYEAGELSGETSVTIVVAKKEGNGSFNPMASVRSDSRAAAGCRVTEINRRHGHRLSAWRTVARNCRAAIERRGGTGLGRRVVRRIETRTLTKWRKPVR